MTKKHLALFNGIGGFQIAAQWVGWENIAHVEIDQFCNRVVAKHFPESYQIRDIHDLTVDNYGNLLYLCEKDIIVMGQPRSSKYDNAVQLYESGMSIQECAEFFEISRQAMHKILRRRSCVFRKNIKFGNNNHFHRGSYVDNAKKKRIQHITEKAIKKGVLTRPVRCEKCNSTQEFKDGRNGIQAHHSDYDKPLIVKWFCQKCHYEWHKSNTVLNESDKEKTGNPSGAIDIVSGGFP